MRCVASIIWPDGTASSTIIESGASLTIGRLEDNQLVLPFKNVSRHHAVIHAMDEEIVITDLSSKNGTILNGKPLSAPQRLAGNDRIKIGDIDILITIQGEMTESDPVTATQEFGMRSVVVTALVADIKGYTRMSEALDPREVTTQLKLWLSDVTRVVEAHGGMINKFLGDGVLAIWWPNSGKGSEHNNSELAIAAITAARAIRSATEALGQGWSYNQQFPWQVTISLNTGEALYGSMKPGEFTFLGDAINIAFRLNDFASSEMVSLVFSASTASLIGDGIKLGEFALPGKDERVGVYTEDLHSS